MTATTATTKTSLPTWKVILKTIQYRKDLWLGNWLAMMILMLFYQIPGLALREFFDSLSGHAQFGFSIWTLIALMLAAEIGSVLGGWGLVTTNVPFFMNTMTLLAHEPAPPHPAPSRGLSPARFARRSHQPLPRGCV